MKIAAGTLSLGLSFFLCSIEFVSSQPRPETAERTTLKELFPGTDGFLLPRIEKLDNAAVESFPNFHILNGRHMVEQTETYVKRGDIIFGFLDKGYIQHVSRLFQPQHLLPYVFNTQNQRWYILRLPELTQMGATRCLQLVRAHDQVAAITHSLHDETKAAAHRIASEKAYYATILHEIPYYSNGENDKTIREHYLRKYNEVYEREVGRPSEGR